MVRILCIIIISVFILTKDLQAAPLVEASVNSIDAHAHYPIPVTITITHKKAEKVSLTSFEMNGKPLEVSFVKDVPMSSSDDTLLSIYQFSLPAQEKGLYILPSIKAKIGDQTYTTETSTYEIKNSEKENHTNARSSKHEQNQPIFKLEAFVKGPTTLYLKERTKLVYRITYNRSVDLSRSVLPMVHPEHFQKIGDVQIVDYQAGELTIQELTQEVEAKEIGIFELGPSIIEGYAYSIEKGQKVFDQTLLKAEAPAITLEVKQFPHAVQPLSFTGALGKIQLQAKLLTHSTVYVGDIIQLQVSIEGVNNLEELTFPLIECQPGFSGFFQISDLPPVAEIKEKTKIFLVELRPLTSLINQIPSIEVSSFDATSNQYIIEKTPPIQIDIKTYPEKMQSEVPLIPVLMEIPIYGKWAIPPPVELELKNVPLPSLLAHTKKQVPILWVMALGIVLLLLQKYWQNRLK